MKKEITAKQSSLLRTIKRHGGGRLMSAVDMRVAKPLMHAGYLIANDGWFTLSDSAKDHLDNIQQVRNSVEVAPVSAELKSNAWRAIERESTVGDKETQAEADAAMDAHFSGKLSDDEYRYWANRQTEFEALH